MEVRMEHTEGLGRQADVWVNGTLLTVCDGISSSQRRTPPGLLKAVKLSYPSMEGFSWQDAVDENPSQKMYLDHERGWSYVGYGKVTSIMPVVIDFGVLKMEDPNWATEDDLIGKYVRVAIGRLEIAPASEQDWPEHIG